jgi:hypothetical protein
VDSRTATGKRVEQAYGASKTAGAGSTGCFYEVGRVGLEPTKAEPADLQSAPFAARDTDPFTF